MKTYLGHHNGRFHGHHCDKWNKKGLKIMKKMAKLEKKFGKHNFVDDNANSDGDSTSGSETGRYRRLSKRRRCRSRSSSSDFSATSISSSSSSSSSRSPSPRYRCRPRHHHHHAHDRCQHRFGHLSRSRSFAGRGSYLPIPMSWEDRRHQHQDRKFDGRPREPYSEGTGDRRQSSVSQEPELLDIRTDINVQDGAADGNTENEQDFGSPSVDALDENWKRIVQNGASGDDSLPELLKRNPVVLRAPKANREIGPITSNVVLRKDATSARVQNEIGAGLSALSQAISNLNAKADKDEMADVRQNLNDAAAIFLDAHYNMTKMRQEHVMLEANRKARAVLEACEHDELLFGKDLEEKARSAKGFERCRKLWKDKGVGNRSEKAGKRKQHACYENEKRKSKRMDTSDGLSGTGGFYVTIAD